MRETDEAIYSRFLESRDEGELRGGEVLGEFRDQFGSHPVLRYLLEPIGELDDAFMDTDCLSNFDGSGGLGIDASDLHLPAFAGVGGFGPGFEYPQGPEDFVYSFGIGHIT